MTKEQQDALKLFYANQIQDMLERAAAADFEVWIPTPSGAGHSGPAFTLISPEPKAERPFRVVVAYVGD